MLIALLAVLGVDLSVIVAPGGGRAGTSGPA
jgi:hypothetical protein